MLNRESTHLEGYKMKSRFVRNILEKWFVKLVLSRRLCP